MSESQAGKPVTIWLTDEEKAALDNASAEANVSRSGLIRTFVAEHLGLPSPNVHSRS